MVKKSLRERLVETSSRTDAQESAKRLAKFLEHWEEVENAFREGWPYKEIWRVLVRDGDIDCSYSSFLNFTRKVKRRQLDYERERTRRANNASAAAAAGKAAIQASAIKPGSTKVDMPLFGQEGRPRDLKRF